VEVTPSDLRDLLVDIEWSGENGSCPRCGYESEEGHSPDCDLADAIDELEGQA
jgi:hypothetical protein